jgi:hypothetical protein
MPAETRRLSFSISSKELQTVLQQEEARSGAAVPDLCHTEMDRTGQENILPPLPPPPPEYTQPPTYRGAGQLMHLRCMVEEDMEPYHTATVAVPTAIPPAGGVSDDEEENLAHGSEHRFRAFQ